MRSDTTADAVEALARNLFKRDHPDRAWSARAREAALTRGAAMLASAEERMLYCAFARAQLHTGAGCPRLSRASH